MNLDKSDVKIGAANELGNRLDDMLEANTKDSYRLEGAVTALQTAASAIDTLIKAVDKEIDEGKLDLEQAGLIKRHMTRAHQVVVNLTIKNDQLRLAQAGRITAFEMAVEIIKKFRDEEMKKAETLRLAYEEAKAKAQANGTGESHPIEVELRPGLSVKARRLAEEASQKAEAEAAQKADGPTETQPAAPATTNGEGAEAPPEEPPKKRGGRRKKV